MDIIHNEVVEILDENDYHFYEGMTLLESNVSAPLYSVDLGNLILYIAIAIDVDTVV